MYEQMLNLSKSILKILGMKQRIDLKLFDVLFSILKNERSAFQNNLKLLTMSFRINERNKKNILKFK